MRLKLMVAVIIVALFVPNLAVAQTRDKLEFEFWQVQYQMNDIAETRLDARELAGELGLQSGLTMKLSYQFWDQSRANNNKLENFTLDTVKNFATVKDEKLAVGIGLDYYQQTTDTEKLDLSQLERKTLQLVLDLEKEIINKVDLFTEVKYGLYSDYQFSNQNLESDISYDSNYDYSIKSGLNFRLGPDLRANLGYKLSQESVERSDGQETMINSHDLTQFSQLQHGLFFGLETNF